MKKVNNSKARKRHIFNYNLQFSSASLLGIVICTHLVFFLLLLFSKSNSIVLGSYTIIRSLIITLLLGAGISFILNRIFISPLIKLTEAMKKVAAGDFSIQLEPKNRLYDLNVAYESFNTMVNELAKIDTLQTDFVSSVSHEFKTPINAIEGYASLLQDSDLSPEQQEIYVEKIMFNTNRLSELVGNVLLLSKLDNQSVQPKLSTYRLDEQIRKAILALESKWEKKEIEFDIELEAVEYTGIEVLMSHVWSNLIDNAVKFSDQGGDVRLRLKRQDDRAVFTIRNFGTTIAADNLERIFSKFYQEDSSRRSEGNGLGLTLAKNIVDSASGSISVTSSESEGNIFTVVLPLKT